MCVGSNLLTGEATYQGDEPPRLRQRQDGDGRAGSRGCAASLAPARGERHAAAPRRDRASRSTAGVVEGDVYVEGRADRGHRARAGSGRRGDRRARDALVLPGFVQAHVHLCQTLFRGLADDLDVIDWLRLRVWPLESAHDEKSMSASARLGCAELLRGGTTTVLSMESVHHTDAAIEAVLASASAPPSARP